MPKTVKTPVPGQQRLAGERIRVVRDLAGVTQEAICEVLAVDQSTWSKWEKGVRTPPISAMSAFATRFKVSLDFIYRGQPVGLHPDLLAVLRLSFSHLLSEVPGDMGPNKDKALDAYKAAIDPVGA